MKSKFLKTLLAACLAFASVIGLAACGGDGGDGGSGGGVINEGKQLNYVLLEDNTYGVKVGECYDVPEITIPAKHEGKKVTTIMSDFFQVRAQENAVEQTEILTYSIVISQGVTTIQANAFGDLYKVKRLEIPKSLVNFAPESTDSKWLGARGIYEICNKGNLDVGNPEKQADFGYIARDAVNVYTPKSGERKMTMNENKIVTFVDENGKKAFMNYCGKEPVLNVPTDVDYIYENACRANGYLKEINVPGNCKSVEDYAFGDCVNVEVVNIAEGVEKIAYSFYNLDNNFLYGNVPQSVTYLSSGAFYSRFYRGVVCYYYAENAFPDGWMKPDSYSGRYKLYDVKSVTRTANGHVYAERTSTVVFIKYLGNDGNLVIQDTVNNKPVTEIHPCAAMKDANLTKVTIGGNVTKVGRESFYQCDNLLEVILSDSVQGVAEYAFADCENLVKVTVGASVSNTYYTAGMPAFSGCFRISEVYNRSTNARALEGILLSGTVAPDNVYTEEGGSKLTFEGDFVLYTDGDVCRLVNYVGEGAEVVIPNKVTEIKARTFMYKSYITKVTIGSGTTKIGERAFVGCSKLETVVIPVSVTNIEYSAFWCYKLTQIEYLGTMDEWKAITKGSEWNHSTLEKVVCSDGEIPY